MATRILSYIPFLVITLLCVGGVELFYRGVEHFLLDPVIGDRKVAEMAAEPEVSKPGTKKLPVDYSVITKRNLFGAPSEAKSGAQGEVPPAGKDLEATSLELVLMGTIGGDEQGARAIILNKKDRKQELYHVGDTVEGAGIKEIQRGKVILHIDDRDEMLDMSEASQYGQNLSAPAAKPAVRRGPILGGPRQMPESIGQEQQPVLPRIVRPSRRIVRPQAQISVEQEGPVAEPPAEEPSPEAQEQELRAPEATEQEAAPAQEQEQQDARQY